MYKPARPRPRLTSITRTRSGCMTCRRRKKRCDETVPQCSACSRLGLDCVPPSTSIKFSSQRTLVGPSPTTSRESWRYETDSSASSPSSGNHGSSSRAPDILSPVTESSPPLLTPAVSYDHLTPEDTPSSLDTPRDPLYPTSLSLHPQDEITFHDLDYSDCSFLLEGDWASLPGPFQLETNAEFQPTYAQTRDAPSYQAQPGKQPWFTALPPEQESTSNSGNFGPISQHSEPSLLYELRKLYINHWETSVLDILSSTFRELSSHIEACETLKSGILALSAAHLGHTHIQVRTKFGTDNEFYIGPNQVHLVYMRQFYDAALRHLSDTISNHSGDSVLILGSLLILMLVEKTVGSFRGEAFHESGIDKLVSEEFGILSEDTLGRALLREWLILRAENWSHRIPFTVLSYGKALAEAGIDFVSFLSQDAVLPIMLESWYQNEMILFERFVGRGDMESISSRCYRFYHGLVKENQHTTLPWRPAECPPDDDYRGELNRLTCALDRWHSGLLLEEHPIESFGPQQTSKRSKFLSSSSDPRLSTIKPLEFRSHRAAMNYAYYLCSRILQSSALISCWEQNSIERDDSKDGSDWILLLLRLLLGLDPKTCFEENIFTIGLSELILVGLQRLPPVIHPDQEQPLSSELFISFARSVVSTFESRSIFREGHCSLECFRDFVYLTDRLRRECGKSMFFLIAGEADTAWTKIYGHGMGTAIILGRNCHTQKLFGERVVIAPGKQS